MEKITKKKEVRITYWITCPCGREIRGDSPKAALHNFRVHKKSKSHLSKKAKGELK
jgi:hypothetical protein